MSDEDIDNKALLRALKQQNDQLMARIKALEQQKKVMALQQKSMPTMTMM